MRAALANLLIWGLINDTKKPQEEGQGGWCGKMCPLPREQKWCHVISCFSKCLITPSVEFLVINRGSKLLCKSH